VSLWQQQQQCLQLETTPLVPRPVTQCTWTKQFAKDIDLSKSSLKTILVWIMHDTYCNNFFISVRHLSQATKTKMSFLMVRSFDDREKYGLIKRRQSADQIPAWTRMTHMFHPLTRYHMLVPHWVYFTDIRSESERDTQRDETYPCSIQYMIHWLIYRYTEYPIHWRYGNSCGKETHIL